MIGNIVNKVCDTLDHPDKEPISEIIIGKLTFVFRCGGLVCIGMLGFLFMVLSWTLLSNILISLYK